MFFVVIAKLMNVSSGIKKESKLPMLHQKLYPFQGKLI